MGPFADNFDEYEDELEHQFVYFDDMEEEMKTVKQQLLAVDKKIKKWRKKTGADDNEAAVVDEKIRNHIFELGKQEFEIISLSRKIMDVEVKLSDLHVHMSDQEKLLTETKIDNKDLQDKINAIRSAHGEHGGRDYYDDEPMQTRGFGGPGEAQSVLEWTVEDVYLWWRVALPRGAQRYIELVKECQLTGVDLLGVDEEMLSQFGMMKVLIHQVLKQIANLKKISFKIKPHKPISLMINMNLHLGPREADLMIVAVPLIGLLIADREIQIAPAVVKKSNFKKLISSFCAFWTSPFNLNRVKAEFSQQIISTLTFI